jgi:hypothetical protein
MAGDPAADRHALAEVINLGLLWHCLCAITRLEVPERLAAGPLPIPQLAAAVGAHPDALWRVLRLLADHHIVTLDGDRVGLTDRGRLVPSWLGGTVVSATPFSQVSRHLFAVSASQPKRNLGGFRLRGCASRADRPGWSWPGRIPSRKPGC